MTKIDVIGRVRRGTRRLQMRFARKGLILLYHRVCDIPLDPFWLAVRPERFAEQMEVLRRNASPMPLGELIEASRNGTLPDRSVAVTFDDGYADNLYHAKPLLERHGVPATIFIASGFVGTKREYWWDELTRLFLGPPALPDTLVLDVNGISNQWRIPEGVSDRAGPREQYRDWNVLSEDFSGRHSVFRSLHQFFRSLGPEEQRSALEQIRTWAGVSVIEQPPPSSLSHEELACLPAGGLLEVGAHTVNHPVLALLPLDAQQSEIQRGKAELETILGDQIRSFAYPFGTSSDYSMETVRTVRNAGFDYACAVNADVVWRRTDPFQLPRFVVRDWDGEEFERELRNWQAI